MTYPQKLPAGTAPARWFGGIVYACCVSTVGPACDHRRDRDGSVVITDQDVEETRQVLRSQKWTVVGVWDSNVAIAVGVIEGDHQVQGGNASPFDGGLWATCVEAETADAAESKAVAEMEDEYNDEDDDEEEDQDELPRRGDCKRRIKDHNTDEGAWCRWSMVSIVRTITRCPAGCAAGEVVTS